MQIKKNSLQDIKQFLYNIWCGFKQPFVMNIYFLRQYKET